MMPCISYVYDIYLLLSLVLTLMYCALFLILTQSKSWPSVDGSSLRFVLKLGLSDYVAQADLHPTIMPQPPLVPP